MLHKSCYRMSTESVDHRLSGKDETVALIKKMNMLMSNSDGQTLFLLQINSNNPGSEAVAANRQTPPPPPPYHSVISSLTL